MSTPLRGLPLWAAVLVAAASGPITDAGFPGTNAWPLTFVGIFLVLLSLRGRSAGAALLVGFVAGASFYFVHIEWASLFLGPLPMSALAVLEALFFSLGALAIALAYRWIPRAWPSFLGQQVLVPLAVAGLWTAREAWASVWPYGGFAWGRVALSQSDSPVSPLFAWLGVSGVSFAMVLIVAAVLEAAIGRETLVGETVIGRETTARRALVPLAIVAVLVALPAWPVTSSGTLDVAAVQGNGKAGYFDHRTDGELLQAQLDASAPLFGHELDLIVWPEGAADRSPLSDRYTAQVFDFVSTQTKAPLMAWAVTSRNGKLYNTEILWRAGDGPLDFYDKKHPVPFGEYVPNRAFWTPFAPNLINLIGRDYTPGTTDMVFAVDHHRVGINICFDIADDQLLQDSVDEGAELIVASTNNADFGMTDESEQQLAIARIRAREFGRTVVNISTVGTSAMIAPDGSIIRILPRYQPGVMRATVSLSNTITPATVWGRSIEWLVSGLGLSILAIASLNSRRRRG
jgi:apolipoprotein N-acyltransferase